MHDHPPKWYTKPPSPSRSDGPRVKGRLEGLDHHLGRDDQVPSAYSFVMISYR